MRSAPRWIPSYPDQSIDLRMQQLDERWIHVVVVIGNVKTDQFLVLQMGAESPADRVDVICLHREDHVGSLDQIRLDGPGCIAVGTGGSSYDAMTTIEHSFRRRTTKFVGAADEENVHRS